MGDIWTVVLTPDGWGNPRPLGSAVNTGENEACPTVSAGGNLYYHAVYDRGLGGSDLYRSVPVDGVYGQGQNVGPPVNSDLGESNAFINADETLLLFGSDRPGGAGQGDIYAAFRLGDGTWSRPVNLGPTINSPASEYCPSLSHDGRWLFFTRIQENPARNGDIFWVSSKRITQMREMLILEGK